MIIFAVQIEIPPEKTATIVNSFRRITEPTKVQPGCINFQVLSDTENDNTILIRQMWESHKPMEKHIASEEFRSILAAMDMALDPPKVNFYTVTHEAGFELVQAILKPRIQDTNMSHRHSKLL